jgi:hypothetical protein
MCDIRQLAPFRKIAIFDHGLAVEFRDISEQIAWSLHWFLVGDVMLSPSSPWRVAVRA